MRLRFACAGPFLCGEFGIVDAMFAPVCVRFRAYGVVLDSITQAYSQAIFSLPAMSDWLAGAEAEPLRVGIYDV